MGDHLGRQGTVGINNNNNKSLLNTVGRYNCGATAANKAPQGVNSVTVKERK